MKKKSLSTIVLFLFVHHILTAQEGVIRYLDNKIKGSSSSLDMYSTVYFKGGEAVFISENARDTSFYTEKGFKATITHSLRNFRCYMNFEMKIGLLQRQLIPDKKQKFLITEKPMVIPNWTLSTESKYIDGFLCKKASCLLNNDTKVDVWYAVEIPVRVGFANLCGLPGLIMEKESIDKDGNIFSTSIVSIKMEKVDMVSLYKTINQGQIVSNEVFSGGNSKTIQVNEKVNKASSAIENN